MNEIETIKMEIKELERMYKENTESCYYLGKLISDLKEKLKCPYNLRPMEESLPQKVKSYQCIKERGHTGNHEFYIQIIGLSFIPHVELEVD